jgi:Protein of unknown function (DUF2815)
MSVTITPDGENQFLVKFTGVYLSYPHLFEPFKPKTPQMGADGKPKPGKYGAKFCFDRKDPQSKQDAVAIHAKCVEMAKNALKQTLPSDRYCVRDGQHLTEDMHRFFVLSASEDTAPIVVDRRRNKVTAEDDLFYPGCKVNATVRLWVQNSQEWGKRINANLVGVQFAEHAERWGGRPKPKAEEVFDDVSENYGDDEYAGAPTGESEIGQDNDGFGGDGL